MEAGIADHVWSVEEIGGLLREAMMMRNSLGFWIVFLAIGALLWLSSIGVWSHPAYRLVLMVVMLTWFGYVAVNPKSS